jgi:histidinol-phosphate aminotransferase
MWDVDTLIVFPTLFPFLGSLSQIVDAITPNVKLIFLCSPGNPTSKLIPLADIRALATHPTISQNCVVVVDEAYIDFAEAHASAVSLLEEQTFANVVVLQTLSKAFGLAAIRCGFCIGPADIIQLMNNVKAPYNVNALTSQMAHDALNTFKTKSIVSKNIAEILEQRQLVAAALQEMDFVTRVFHSDANFILFQVQSQAHEIYKYMADTENVVTRYRGTELHCTNGIRVTIGTPEENQAFLRALRNAQAHVISKASN